MLGATVRCRQAAKSPQGLTCVVLTISSPMNVFQVPPSVFHTQILEVCGQRLLVVPSLCIISARRGRIQTCLALAGDADALVSATRPGVAAGLLLYGARVAWHDTRVMGSPFRSSGVRTIRAVLDLPREGNSGLANDFGLSRQLRH